MTAQIIPLIPQKETRVCSFCKTTEAKAKCFFASTVSNHCICGECVKKAKQRMDESK